MNKYYCCGKQRKTKGSVYCNFWNKVGVRRMDGFCQFFFIYSVLLFSGFDICMYSCALLFE
jgi:hypothetical protein